MAMDFSSSERMVPTGGCYDCGGRCVHKAYVNENTVVRVETDDGEEPQLRSCVRGRALRQHLHSPDRLLHPLRRVGARGEGRFERISWEEALDTIAREIARIKEVYGSQAILAMTFSGMTAAWFHQTQLARQYRQVFGQFTKPWGNVSCEGSVFAAKATYGTMTTSSTRDDLVNSRLIILWGIDPAVAIISTNTSYYLLKAKEAGAKIISIDPRLNDTAAAIADQWIATRPGTDTALVIAMAYVMIVENLHDQRFLDRYTVGFDKFSGYVLGHQDGTAKTPAWAERITGVPGTTIVAFAREYATKKPAALIAGFGPGRTAFGEQYHRAVATLAALTGNVGIPGGDAGAFHLGPIGAQLSRPFDRSVTNANGDVATFDVPGRSRLAIHFCRLWDAILAGTAGGYPVDLRMAYIVAGNPLNQLPNINKGVQALRRLEFVVVHERFMTATARFADILLPATFLWERNDFSTPWMSAPYSLCVNKVVEPIGEAKSDIEVFRELGRRMGISDPSFYSGEQDGIREVVAKHGDVAPGADDLELFKQRGVHKVHLPEPQISFRKQIEDPENNPFPTPSGKIEIYSDLLAQLNDPLVPPIPKYIQPWEGPEDALTEQFPLQLITIHHKTRAHSNFDNTPWLREVEPQSLWINADDARQRGIENGDAVRVFNDRGETTIEARVTQRIMPGVVSLGEGAWYRPDDKGLDTAGSPNVLTRDHYSPGGALPSNSCLVQVQRVRT